MSIPRDESRSPGEADKRRRSGNEIRSWLVAAIAERCQVAPETIGTREPFVSFGIPSKEAVAMSGALEDWLGQHVSPTALWEYPTIESLAMHLAAEAEEPAPDLHGDPDARGTPIALIGIGCRFPGAPSPAAFWRLLTEGRDAITEVPADRWDLNGFYDPDPTAPGTLNTRWGGFVEHVDRFDAAFFGIAPREASRIDPQQRLLLEVAWEALEDGCQPVERLAGTRVGVFIGISTNDYGRRQFSRPSLIDAYAGTGNALSIAANRISYQFDFAGPSVAIDTACSSSLVAVHLACRSISNGEVTMALAGGVNLILSPEIAISFTKAGVMAPDGRCKAFDARANGYVRGEGAGVVVLKPLPLAVADGDPIYAVILGSAVNNDGRTNGLMAPSRQAQEAVLREAYGRAGVSPGLVQYVEAHGTGTLLGDPIEVKALGAVLAMNRPPDRACALGSVKTNVGHLEAAAGVAGLIKVALALKHGAIPPSLHFETPNPHIPFADLPLRVQQTMTDWPATGGRRLAGVSSFGFGGTNAHVVLRDLPAASTQSGSEEPSPDGMHIMPLSARSPEALRAVARESRDLLSGADTANVALQDICYTAAARRTHHEYRLAVTGRTRGEVIERIDRCLADEVVPRIAGARQLVFVFPGQGSQWAGMGRQLLRQEPVFRASLEECDSSLRKHVDWSLVERLTAAGDASRLDEIDVVQPALFGVQVALAALWRSWGIEPATVVGHSMGEVAAACVAGALTLADAARIICERSRLLRSVSGRGGMAVVDVPIDTASRAVAAFQQHLSIASENSPSSTVLSGDTTALTALLGRLEQQGVLCRLINVDVASHSAQVDPVLGELRHRLASVRPRIATVPLFSTVTARTSNGLDLDVGYWVRNLREPVLFSTVVQQLLAGGCTGFLEVSPHPVLLGAIQQGVQSSGRRAAVLPSLHRGEDERATMLQSLASLYGLGFPVQWDRLFPAGARSVPLASYPWQRERCWFDVAGVSSQSSPDVHRGAHVSRQTHPLLGRHLNHADDATTHSWETELSAHSPPFLADHRLDQHAVVPAAAYVEMALAAADELFGGGCGLTDVEFTRALVLDAARPDLTLQLVVSEGGGREPSFRIFSTPRTNAPKQAWTLHATGTIRRDVDARDRPTPLVDVSMIRAACPDVISGDRYYSSLRESGLHYGPCFQGLERVWRNHDEAVGRIRVPAALEKDLEDYPLHPAVLDAAFQVIGATVSAPGQHSGLPYFPVRIGEVRIHNRRGTPVWSIASRVDADGPSQIVANLRLLDAGGQVIAEVRSLRLRRLGQEAGDRTRDLDAWLYERQWELTPLSNGRRADAAATTGGRWIVFADRGSVAQRLVSIIEAHGADSCAVVRPGNVYRAEGDAYQIDPGDPTHVQRLMEDIGRPDGQTCRGIVHLWNLDSDVASPDLDALESAQLRGCTSVLHVIQAVAGAGTSAVPRLFLVTRRAQCVGADQSLSVAQSPVWGLARTIAHEHPEVRCTSVDLGDAGLAELESLRDELNSQDNEDQIALREHLRYVARLARLSLDDGTSPPVHPFRLEAEGRGVIDRLTMRPLTRRRPGAGHVEIEVEAAGVNFMDVMRTLGLVALPADSPVRPGAECVGRVVTLGAGVKGMRQGDEVIAIAPGSFASFATTSSALVVRKPEHLSVEEAATIPVAFITAYLALHHTARLRASERVLIHAAAGGVGLAAVQIARWKGAEIFATAGSLAKREYLRSLGVEHVFDSRSLAFCDEVMARTGGEGVDVVLNSLSGEFAARSLLLLRRGGRFVEIGKRDIHENRSLHLRPFEKNLAFFAVDLQQLAAERPALVGAMLRRLVRRFEDGTLTPLPVKVFPMTEAAEALRFMAQARHTGKIVLSVPDRESSGTSDEGPPTLRAEATYLITGGLGGIGLTVAQWLLEQGARHLALLGRHHPSPDAEKTLAQLRESGADVRVFAADAANRDQMAAVLAAIGDTMPPLRGVVHAAGVLDDGVLRQLDRARMAAVARPKIDGAWNLHTLTSDTPLDFFILFSSAASVLGSPGQGNYAAANAFLDALAHYRRINGLPALSINWGPWGEVGLAARRGRADRLARGGVDTIAPQDGVEVLGRLLRITRYPQVAVVPFDWDRLDRRAATLPLLVRLTEEATGPGPASAQGRAFGATRNAILRTSGQERERLLQSFVRTQLAEVLGLTPSSIDAGRPLNMLGVDSLMAIELKNRVERELAVTLPIATLLQAPDVLQLAAHLAHQLTEHPSDTGAPATHAEHLPEVVPDSASRYLPFPLNDIQGAYWVGRNRSLELGGVGSHFYLEFERTALDVERLAAAWRQLIERHEMLRAVVREDGQQQILEDVPAYVIGVTDLRNGPESEGRAQAEAVRERMAHQLYDPAQWPLFEIHVTKLRDGRTRTHVSIDLLIADVWSLFILFREWGTLYEQRDAQLPPITLSFRDYLLADAALQATSPFARAQAYWTARLPTLPPGPDLPLARAPASIATPRFVRRGGRLEAAVWRHIKVRARQSGLTPSMVLCTAFTEVLAAWSKDAQFTLNVTLFHRLPLHPDVQAVVGDFTSTVLLAVDGRAGSLVERTRQLQQQLWTDLEHRAVSGVRVLRDLARQSGSGLRVATLPVVFTSTLGQESGGTMAPTAWLGGLVYGISQTPQVWLDHQVGEDGEALVFNWDAVEALFPEGLLDAMFAAYCRRLERLGTDETTWTAPTPVLIPDADVHLLAAMNATAAPLPDVTLPALVAAQVELRPDAPAVIAPARQLSYAELAAMAAAVARWLRLHAAQPNRLVAVVMDKGWEQVVAVVGVGQAGTAYLPIDADVPPERLRLLLDQGGATLALTQSWLRDTLAWPPGMTLLAVDEIEPGAGEVADQVAGPVAKGDDLAYVMFTSGSTGVPKGVMMTHRAVVNTLLDINARWGAGPGDRVLALSALSFDLSVYDIFGVLSAGGAVVLPDAAGRRDPAHWLARLAETGVTVWNTVPALMQLLIETAEARGVSLPDTLRLVLLSGDWIPVSLPDRIRAVTRHVQVISLGGATEAAIWSIAYPIETVDANWSSIPYGRPLANQTWHVLHADGTPCPVWVPGELYIGGAGLAQGYWKDDERTRERFVQDPQTGERLYRTGDWGRYRPGGELEFLGRDDLQVKVHGYRIELGEIEAALVRQPGVAQAVAATEGDRIGDKRLVAYVVGRDATPDAAALRAALQSTLPAYMVPSTVHVLPSLPLTANGKVDRHALPSVHPSAASMRGAVGSTDSTVGEHIERLVARVLKIDRVDREADLVTLGLTSIDMMRLANELERHFGFRPRIAHLFTLTSVADVTAYYEHLLEERRPGSPDTSERLLLDPDERDAFKREQRRLRPLAGSLPPVRLPPRSAAASFGPSDRVQRRSHRTFSRDPVAFTDFAALLGCLGMEVVDGRSRHLYGSAGGLYPVQAYLHVQPTRVSDLAAGTYYYHPVEHSLVPLSRDVDLPRTVHAVINRPVFDQAAFSIFLVSQMNAIAPVYAERARDFALIEAGLISQLLEASAERYRIGLCQIGLVDFDSIRDLFLLEESHVFLHSLLGGPMAPVNEAWEEGVV